MRLIERTDWTDPLPQGVALLSTKLLGGRLRVEVSGAEDPRVQVAVLDRFGLLGDVEVVPRRLEPRRCQGHMEREERRLQLRYDVCGDEHMDMIHVAEDERSVVVFGVMCIPLSDEAYDGHIMDSPYHVYLDQPLGERTVIDGFTGEVVPYKNVYIELQRKLGQSDERDEWVHS